MLALLFGVVAALGQELPGIMPKPAQTAEKPKLIHLKHAASRNAAPKISAPATVAAKTISLNSESAKTEPAPAAFSEIPPDERLKIQSALLWSGDYTGSIGGEDPLLSAIKNFQKRARSKVTGVLSPNERGSLLAAAKAHEDEFGWTIVADPSTGVRLGLPTKLVSQVRDCRTRYALVFGAWRSAGRNLPYQGYRPQARRSLRTTKERAVQPQDRKQLFTRRQFLYQRHAGSQEILRTRIRTRR